jgi:hypothetical protein
MTLTPRAKFQAKIDQARIHRDLVVSDGFRNALEAALLEQILALPNIVDQAEAAASYHRIMGATEFIRHLLSIAETSTAPKSPPTSNLNHNIR